MEITEIRIMPAESTNSRLKAFASVAFDHSFVVRSIRVVEGDEGLFIAMPNRKLEYRCRKCGTWNVYHSNYCNECGDRTENPAPDGERVRTHLDIAHPVTSSFRTRLQEAVISAYREQVGHGGIPGPVSPGQPTGSP